MSSSAEQKTRPSSKIKGKPKPSLSFSISNPEHCIKHFFHNFYPFSAKFFLSTYKSTIFLALNLYIFPTICILDHWFGLGAYTKKSWYLFKFAYIIEKYLLIHLLKLFFHLKIKSYVWLQNNWLFLVNKSTVSANTTYIFIVSIPLWWVNYQTPEWNSVPSP